MKKLWKVTLIIFLIITYFGIDPMINPAFADPAFPVGRMPICGDQDGSETPLILNCLLFLPNHDVAAYQVKGSDSVSVRFDFVYREAVYDNELGFFRVDDAGFTINGLHPGDPGYLAAAFDRAWGVFPSGSDAYAPDVTLDFDSESILAFFIIQDDTLAHFKANNPSNDPDKLPLAFFSITALNPDGMDHFIGYQKLLSGITQFGFEDLTGGGDLDYDDVVYNMSGSLTPIGVYDFKQYDPQWDDVSPTGQHTSPYLFLNNTCWTLHYAGCAITSYADVLATYGEEYPATDTQFSALDINPHTLNDFLASHYSNTCYMPWNTAGNHFGMSEEYIESWQSLETRKNAVHNALANGNLPILQVSSSASPNGMHFVVAYEEVTGTNNSVDYKIADPAAAMNEIRWFSKSSYTLRSVIVYDGGLAPGTTFALRAHSPVQLLVTDPSGNQTGYIASTDSYVAGIPQSAYDLELGLANDTEDSADPLVLPPSAYFQLSNPRDGTYILQVIGTGSGLYLLEFDNADASGAVKQRFISGIAASGQIDTFHFTIPSSATEPANVERQVNIDIKPGPGLNPINLGSRGLLPVAILSSSTYDATTVNPKSIQFGPNDTPIVRSSKQDVNKDGRLDLMLQFDNTLTGIAIGDTQACLVGQDKIGAYIGGCDSIVVVPPKK